MPFCFFECILHVFVFAMTRQIGEKVILEIAFLRGAGVDVREIYPELAKDVEHIDERADLCAVVKIIDVLSSPVRLAGCVPAPPPPLPHFPIVKNRVTFEGLSSMLLNSTLSPYSSAASVEPMAAVRDSVAAISAALLEDATAIRSAPGKVAVSHCRH